MCFPHPNICVEGIHNRCEIILLRHLGITFFIQQAARRELERKRKSFNDLSQDYDRVTAAIKSEKPLFVCRSVA